ncbi:MAG: hypothetical protein JNM56_18160 [Planctomycetia bacterium]|nr:hypothetical protein [Planctomycetia bacterium]
MTNSTSAALTCAASFVLCGLTACPCAAAAQPTDFDTMVRPFLKQYCLACHGAAVQKGELRLDDIVAPTRNLAAAFRASDKKVS